MGNTLLIDWSRASECLKTLSHPQRLRLIHTLKGGQQNVGALAEYLGVPHSVCCEHLRLMQRCGFLSSTREGKFKYYKIKEPHIFEILDCIERRFDTKN